MVGNLVALEGAATVAFGDLVVAAEREGATIRDRLVSFFAGAPSDTVIASARPRRASSASARARSAFIRNAASDSARSRSILVFVSAIIVFAVFVVDAAALVDFDVDVDFVPCACFCCLNVALVRGE